MLDESLPTFVIKTSNDKPKVNSQLLYSRYGSEFEPSYSLRHLDPEQPASKNRYAVGLYDSFVPDVLYAEVLLIPEWTQPTLSAEQIRANGGVPPPPEAILPTQFQIQLYNPDQQILVRYKPATFTKEPSWEFEMPQQTFREPSTSKLDRSQDDPTVSDLTPKTRMKWKKDGKFNKDLACYQSGMHLNPDGTKRRDKEPDITLAIYRNLKEVTLYEPNWSRIDIEDLKGFEVVLLLGAIVIRDVYFTPMKETFNLGSSVRKVSGSNSKPSLALPQNILGKPMMTSPSPAPALPDRGRGSSIPPTDPRSQWELDAETARLKRQQAEEEKQRKRREEAASKELKKMLEAENKELMKRQAQIDKETERLRKKYGQEDAKARPALPLRPDPRRQSPQALSPIPQLRVPNSWGGTPNAAHSPQPGPYMTGAASQSSLLAPGPSQPLKQKSSFFGFRRLSDQESTKEGTKLTKKRSSMW